MTNARARTVAAAALAATTLLVGLSGCSSKNSASETTTASPADSTAMSATTPGTADPAAELVGPGCADYAKQNPAGPASVAGMAQDPVATAASNNPMLATLTSALSGKLNPQVNLVETLGSYVLGAGTLILIFNLIRARRSGKLAGPNPWGAATLEWAMPSPPPVYNFAEVPVVRSRMPLWEDNVLLNAGIPHGQHAEDTEDLKIAGTKVGEVSYPDDTSKMSTHDLGIHLPPPSLYPIILAFAMTVFFGGFLLHWAVSVLGVVAIALLVFAMAFEPGHSH